MAAPVCIPTNSALGFLSPQRLQHVFVDLFMMFILTCVKWYLIVVFICMFLMAGEAEHPFICLWAPLYVPLVEVSVQVLCLLFNWILCLPGRESCEFFIYLEDQILI